MRTEGGKKAAIGDFAAAWNLRQSYEVNGVGAGGHAGAETLGESAKVVGVGANPDRLIWTVAEVVVLKSLVSLGVNDRVGFGAVGAGAEHITRGIQAVDVRRNDMCMGPDQSASVRRGFSHGGDEMWRRHPLSLCWGLRCGDGVQARWGGALYRGEAQPWRWYMWGW